MYTICNRYSLLGLYFRTILTTYIILSLRCENYIIAMLEMSLSCCSVVKSCLTLCDPVNCSMPDSYVLHYLLELAQIHVHWVGYAVLPSHPLPHPSPIPFSLSQHKGLFQWVSPLHQVAKVLELQLQQQSFQWMFRVDSFRIDWLDLFVVQRILKIPFMDHSLVMTKVACITQWSQEPCHAPGRITEKSSDKTWSTGERNGNLLQYSCLKIPTYPFLKDTYYT